MLHIHKDLDFPGSMDFMALELMIRRCLNCRAKLVPVTIKALAFCATGDFILGPGFDCEVDEHDTFSIEEKKNLVEPINNLGGLIRTSCLEVALLNSTERQGVNQDATQGLRSGDKRFFTIVAAGQDTDVGSMLEQLELLTHKDILNIRRNAVWIIRVLL